MTSMINISVLNHIVLEMVLKNLNTSFDLNLTTVAVLGFFFNVYDERSAWQKSKTAERGVSFKSGLPQKDHAVDHAQVTPSVITYLRGKINPGEVILLIHVTVFTKSRQHVCHVRRKIQMSDVGFVKIIIIWCLRLPIGRRRVKSFREDWCNSQPYVMFFR